MVKTGAGRPFLSNTGQLDEGATRPNGWGILLKTSTCIALVGVILVGCGGDGTVTAPPVASKLAFTVQPTNSVAGVSFGPPVAVTIEDQAGTPVTSATNAVTLAIGTNPGGGTLSGTTTVSAVNGVATFNLSIQKAASGYTLAASSPSLSGATSGSFAITPAAPAQLAFAVPPLGAQGGQPITPAVQIAVQDAFGNVATSATNAVTLAIGTNPGGGTLSGMTTSNAANGVAVFPTLSISKAGVGYTLAASAAGLTGVTSNAFDVVVFSSVSAGGFHTCGVTTGGAAYCWGDNSRASQLGDGNLDSYDSVPVLVSGGLTFTSLSAGYQHTCGVTTGGAAYCWGDNSLGQLGNGMGSAPASRPVLVSGGLMFASVSAGADHTCGVTTSGVAYCWGYNYYGALGTGSTALGRSDSVPVAVSGGLTFALVSAGSQHTCGITLAGAAYCWGYNNQCSVGNGTCSVSGDSTPRPVSGGLTFATLRASGFHTCGLTTSGAAYCWGWNADGQLGDGSTTNRAVPVPIAGALAFASVSAGGEQTCGVTTGGAAYCWGSNRFGQLGNGVTTSSLTPDSTPVPVTGALTFSSVSSGEAHICGLTTSGVAYCWGDNRSGALGLATATGPQQCGATGDIFKYSCSAAPLVVD